ncbi:MAG: threonine synthase [Synechococcus sp.]
MSDLRLEREVFQVQCASCHATEVLSPDRATCSSCGGKVLVARYDLAAINPEDWMQQVSQREATMWRYRELLPVSDPKHIVSLGAGFTPLISADRLGAAVGHTKLLLKDERQGPTGSFKDRQAAVAISVLKEQGVTELVLASTGNVGIAYSALAARAGIRLWVFVPAGVPDDKLREIQLYGTNLVRIDDTYDRAKAAAAAFARQNGLTLDRGIKSLAGVESMKTLAFEVAEQLDWTAPDWYIQAVSGGMGPLGVAKGFAELNELGLIDKVPALGLVQPQGCAPIVDGLQENRERAMPVDHPETDILPLATGNPGDAYPLLKQAVDTYGGAGIAISDRQAFATQRLVAQQEGISVEPATATAIAGALGLIQQGTIAPHETVVVNCSGHTYAVDASVLANDDITAEELPWGIPSKQRWATQMGSTPGNYSQPHLKPARQT